MVIKNDKITLLELIQLKKTDMLTKAKYFGRTHPVVLKSSQELDTLLNQHQKYIDNK